MTVERDEFEKLRGDLFGRVNKLESDLRLLVQSLEVHKERADEKFSYNGNSHDSIRGDVNVIETELKDIIRPAISWVLGIRRAWRIIGTALVVAIAVAVGTALMQVYTYLKSLPGVQ